MIGVAQGKTKTIKLLSNYWRRKRNIIGRKKTSHYLLKKTKKE